MIKKGPIFLIFVLLFSGCINTPKEMSGYKDLNAKYLQALQHIGRSEYKNADKLLKKIIQIDNRFYRAYQKLVDIYARQKKLDELVPYLETFENACSLWALGLIFENKGSYEPAITQYKKSVDMENRFFKVYISLVDTYWRKEKDKHKAAVEVEEYFNSVEAAFPDNPDIQFGLGYLFFIRNNYKEAFSRFERAVELNPGLGEAHRRMGIIYAMRGNFKDALEKFQQCFTIVEEEGDLQEQGTALTNIGLVYGFLSENEKAAECYENALAIAVEIGDKQGLQAANGNLGNLYLNMSQSDKSLEYNKKALALAIELGSKSVEASVLLNMGLAYGFLSEHQKALEYYTTALSIYKETGNPGGEGMALNNLGTVHVHLSKYQAAIEYYNEALSIARKTGRKRHEGVLMSSIAVVYEHKADYIKALEYYENALSIVREIGYKMEECNVLGEMGKIYMILSEYTRGRDYYEQALVIAREIGERRIEALNIQNIGKSYQQLQENKEALEHYTNALEIFREIGYGKGEVEDLIDIGLVFFGLSDYSRALEYSEKVLAIAREKGYRENEGRALEIIGRTYQMQSEYSKAIDSLQNALEIFRETGNKKLEGEVLNSIGEIHFALNDYPEALSYYEKSIFMIESIRRTIKHEPFKTGFFSNIVKPYENIITLLYSMHIQSPEGGYDEQGFTYAERSKARGLLDLLAESAADIDQGVDPELREEERDIERQYSSINTALQHLLAGSGVDVKKVSNLRGELKALDRQFEQLKLEIIRKNPGYGDLKYPEPVTLKRVRDSLPGGETVLLNYKVAGDSVFAWRITTEGKAFFKLPVPEEALNEMVLTLRNCITAKLGKGLFAEQASGLYEALLKPLLAGMEKRENLFIIPDGVLNYLPFEALISELPEGGGDYKDMPFLIREYTIRYAPSAGVAVHKQKREKSPGMDLFALGDPVFLHESMLSDNVFVRAAIEEQDRSRFGRLIHSGEEVKNIGKLFKKTSIYVRDEALEEHLKVPGKMEDYRYIHLATHGLLNEVNPYYSGMVLTQDDDPVEDGFLLMREVFNLELNADLVVLSACNTGMGKSVQAEGIVGLTRAWMYAGTPALIVSLWGVNDQSTRYLMEKLYGYIKENVEYGQALRMAKLDLIRMPAGEEKNFGNPFYWAGFVFTGNMWYNNN